MNKPFASAHDATSVRYKSPRNPGEDVPPAEPIQCSGGAFELPPSAFARLESACVSGLVYLRHDEDTLTISPVRLVDGRRRRLRNHYRVPMFRTATRLAVLELGETIVLMPAQWRSVHAKP